MHTEWPGNPLQWGEPRLVELRAGSWLHAHSWRGSGHSGVGAGAGASHVSFAPRTQPLLLSLFLSLWWLMSHSLARLGDGTAPGAEGCLADPRQWGPGRTCVQSTSSAPPAVSPACSYFYCWFVEF